jgi:hypothetical protein
MESPPLRQEVSRSCVARRHRWGVWIEGDATERRIVPLIESAVHAVVVMRQMLTPRVCEDHLGFG